MKHPLRMESPDEISLVIGDVSFRSDCATDSQDYSNAQNQPGVLEYKHDNSRTVVKEVSFKSSIVSTDQSLNSYMYSQGGKASPLNASCNNSSNTGGTNSGGRCKSRGGPPPGQKPAQQRRRRGGAQAADLMEMGVQNTVEQAKQMHIKGADCARDDPYGALQTETFGQLLKGSGGRRRLQKRKLGRPKKTKTKWCKPKVNECDGIQLQLCPHLGEGHTHEKLIEEVTPVLLQTAQNLDCQLREICRRLFFMKHNVPQMTAPALVNFHAILSKINKMLIADFTSFPSGLKLPNRLI